MPTTLFDYGDALSADRIVITTRKLSKPALVNQSGRHKAIVAGVNDRCLNRMAARVVTDTPAASLERMFSDHTEKRTPVLTDEARGYLSLPRMGFNHSSVIQRRRRHRACGDRWGIVVY